MLDIDKSTVDFLVTENMVQEVEKVLSHDVPLVHIIVEEMVKREIDRIYFVACGSFFRSSGLRYFRLGVLR
ncbi:putative fructoselysine 6-phosphate deglycase [Escherichia coli 1-176-05_S3_C2]|nr:putative fructoselysine 6-phosphate deglycase [Escherichia coli 1-176-05_S3_C2]